ncbi:MAG: WD40/YVTN/BNR-like repeat-containing protein [Thermoanaerobaculaceae bacterium]
MSGRVAAIDAAPGNPGLIFVGAATGGVWRSKDGGLTFQPVFDQEKVASVGALAIASHNTDIIWVGTGEGNPRNSASVGYGVWLSRDGGESFQHVGLEKTERIHRIIPHPRDPLVAYVCAMGQMWGENPERGVFKTTDGGVTWTKVLYVDEKTGCADLIMDPENPEKLFAAMWTFRRWPYFFQSGGQGSGLFVTHDGGATWKKLGKQEGLPDGELGRIGLGICAGKPQVVYALVEAKTNVLLRSEDGGKSFVKVSEGARVGERPFYYADIEVDPVWPQRVYDLASRLRVSDDGGKSFRALGSFRILHPDFHALWINPQNPNHLIAGNDGGVAISYDRGESWRFVSNLPLGQYYHVNVDLDQPYNIYGGLQDNGSWRGPSAVWENGGIRNHHWQEVGFGDGFDVSPDPEDSLRGYSMSQEGYLRRWNLRTGEIKEIRPPSPPGVTLRFNWNAAFAQDPFDAATIYYGSQFLHRSQDRGETWEIISPDLTTNNPAWQRQRESGGLTPDVTGAENYTTILTIAPSPVAKGVIWVGTDDGRIHITKDNGAHWVSVEGRIRGVPPNTWIPHIEASKHTPGRAYVVFDDHRRSNWNAYLFVTEDFGETWKSLNTQELWGYCLVIEEDPVDPNLLFVGTEFGLYVSQNRGNSFWRFTNGLPTASVMDLVVHPREADLVIATHGRSLFIVDDISPLRFWSPDLLRKPLHLYPGKSAQQYRRAQPAGPRFAGDTEFRGENRAYGAFITFFLNDPSLPQASKADLKALGGGLRQGGVREGGDKEKPKVKLVVRDAKGSEMRSFEVPVYRGLNRAVWDLTADPFPRPSRGETPFWEEPRGPEVPPGSYTVEVRWGELKEETQLQVLPDPKSGVSPQERQRQWQALVYAGKLQGTASAAIDALGVLKEDLNTVTKRLEKQGQGAQPGDAKGILEKAERLLRRVEEVEKLFWVPPDTKGIVDWDNAWTTIREAAEKVASSWDPPTPGAMGALDQARGLLEKALAAYKDFQETELAPFKKELEEAGFSLLPNFSPAPLPEVP